MRSIIRHDYLKKHIHTAKLDIENGLVLDRAVSENKSGYLQSHVGGKVYLVHQMIAVAAGYDILGKVINHKDGNKKNNRLDNLEVVTQLENVRHGYKTGLTNNQKYDYNKIYELRDSGLGHRKIAAQLEIPMSTIQHILKKRA